MKRYLNTRVIAKVLGINLGLLSAALLICAGVALVLKEDTVPFLVSALITFLVALLLMPTGKDRRNLTDSTSRTDLNRPDAYFTVTVSWVLMSLAGALPYLLSGSIPHVVDAVFESVSGFSTTGASILTDIEVLPRSILFWRSLTHWIGGIGIIILVIVVMPSFKIGGYHLFTMESSLQQKIRPKTRSIGFNLLMIYVSLTVLEIIFLKVGGMSLFESVCHSFGTVATGGFSPKNTSIAGYSPYIQYVIAVFMLLAGVNFSLYFYLVRREFGKIQENQEFRLYLGMVAAIGAIITAAIFLNMNKSLEESFREAFFQVISIITCTGFATADYLVWPVYAWILLFLAMFLGGSTGSTSGGIKMARHLILWKNFQNIFRRMIHPTAVLPIRINNKHLSEDANQAAITFIALYMIVFVIGSFLLTLIGADPVTSVGSVATCMAGIGPGLGTTGPVSNFAHLPDTGKILLSMLMLLGRLEIYTVLILFTGSFWTPRHARNKEFTVPYIKAPESIRYHGNK